MLLQKNTVFFDLFEGLVTHVVSSAEHLRQLAVSFPATQPEAASIRDEEHAADRLTHEILERLDQTFLPPIDREDIHTLAGQLDDIIDLIDALAQRFGLYHVESIEPLFVTQTGVLVQSAVTLRDAVYRLRKSRKLSDLGPTLIEIHRLESVGDDNHHAALSKLFDGSSAPLFVLKWKELHTLIERAIDACEDVGNTLERIVLKGF